MDSPFIGAVHMFGYNFTPLGWLNCDGSLQPISEYMTLYSLLGTAFGGDGQSTFGLPDLRGRVPIGLGQAPGFGNYVIGQMAGTENLTLTTANLPSHTHAGTIQIPVAAKQSTAEPTGAYYATADSSVGNFYADTGTVPMAANTGVTTTTGESMPFEIRNPFLAIIHAICVQGVYPSRS